MPSYKTLNAWLADGLNQKTTCPGYAHANLSRLSKATEFFFGYKLADDPRMRGLYKVVESYEANHVVGKKSEVDLESLNTFLSQPGIRDGKDK
jgi:hypothetical protein